MANHDPCVLLSTRSLNTIYLLMRTLLGAVCRRDASYDGRVPNIVLIEDEPGIVDFIDRGLTARGFEVRAALDGDTGLQLAMTDHVDLVVLDLMLPGKSGMQVLTELAAQRPGLPVIVLTARGEIEDRVGGLDAGAVDYLVKPFALAELEARIRAQLRAARQTPETTIRRGGLEIDLLSRAVRSHGEPVRLTNTEFDLLAYFMNHPGQVPQPPADPPGGLGVRPRPGDQHRRCLHRLPAAQADRR